MDDQERHVEGIAKGLAELHKFFLAQRWKYCVVGGLAASFWGQPRNTSDIDVALLTGFGGESDFIDPLVKHFATRSSDAVPFAIANRILLLNSSQGIPIDISLAAIPFEESMLKRARIQEILPGVRVRTASAEDIVVMKVIASRPRDIDDLERIVATRGGKLDQEYIRHCLNDLAQFWTDGDLIGAFEAIVQSVTRRMKSVRQKPQRKKR